MPVLEIRADIHPGLVYATSSGKRQLVGETGRRFPFWAENQAVELPRRQMIPWQLDFAAALSRETERHHSLHVTLVDTAKRPANLPKRKA